MTTKQKTMQCIKWIESSALLAKQWMEKGDYEEATHIIEHWIIKDAKEAVQYLKYGIKDEEPHEHHS